jgi:hypothetical protein
LAKCAGSSIYLGGGSDDLLEYTKKSIFAFFSLFLSFFDFLIKKNVGGVFFYKKGKKDFNKNEKLFSTSIFL